MSEGRKPPVGHIRRCESETHIARDVSRMQPRAGGVSPPWHALRTRDPNAEIHRVPLADAVRKATAGSRPPLLAVFDCR
jgi:hypothetical protein